MHPPTGRRYFDLFGPNVIRNPDSGGHDVAKEGMGGMVRIEVQSDEVIDERQSQLGGEESDHQDGEAFLFTIEEV